MALAEPKQVQEVTVVMVPFPAQGHLNQLLHLSLLSAHGLTVHYATSSSHISQAKSHLQGWQPASLDAIHFHDLPIPPFSTPLQDPNAATAFPSHLQPSLHPRSSSALLSSRCSAPFPPSPVASSASTTPSSPSPPRRPPPSPMPRSTASTVSLPSSISPSSGHPKMSLTS